VGAHRDYRLIKAAHARGGRQPDPSELHKAGSLFDTHVERLTKNEAMADLVKWADVYSDVTIGDVVVDPLDAIKATHLRAPRREIF